MEMLQGRMECMGEQSRARKTYKKHGWVECVIRQLRLQ